MPKKRIIVSQLGIVPEDFTTPVNINDITQNITATLKCNHKKGHFKVEFKWNYQAITGDDEKDSLFLHAVSDLLMHARTKGLEWQREWMEAQKDEDKDQMEIGFETEDNEQETEPAVIVE